MPTLCTMRLASRTEMDVSSMRLHLSAWDQWNSRMSLTCEKLTSIPGREVSPHSSIIAWAGITPKVGRQLKSSWPSNRNLQEKNATSSEEDDGSIQFSFFFPFYAGGSPSYLLFFFKLNFTPGDGLNPRGQPWAQTYTSTYLRWSGSLVDMPTPSAYRMQLAWLKVNVAAGSLNPTAEAWGEESISGFRLSAWWAQEIRLSAES